MNYIADAILECIQPSENDVAIDILKHYGTKFHSGRYPYGSGENPYQHEKHPRLTKSEVVDSDFLERVESLRKKKDFTWTDTDGLWGPKGTVYTGDTAIAHYMGLSTKEFRPAVSVAKFEIRNQEASYAKQRRDEGASYKQIADELGYPNDSSVRALLMEDVQRRKSIASNNADFLRKCVDEHGFVEVGKGQEINFGTSKEKWNESLEILKMDGYEVYPRRFEQKTNPGKFTTFSILCKPGTEQKELYSKDFNADSIYFPSDEFTSHDNGDTFDKKYVYPKSMDSKRVAIRYSEEGGIDKDGVIEIRRGVADLDLGGSHYAQVRILVDGTHYMKGMAVYGDDADFPPGKDVIYNSNKPLGTPQEKVFKEIKRNADGTPKEDPFGSLIKSGINDPDDPTFRSGGQSYYYDKNGKKQLSLINKRGDEGDWGDWADKLPAQFLSKQELPLINKQLKLSEDLKRSEYDDIMSITNPTVRKVMLDKFADSCDKASETLKAAALPRQKYQVILPLTTISDDEVYAPNYKDGEKVCLIRFPHGGTFEIPYLTVNNKNAEGEKVITKNAADAVGISKKVADQLSGADFDGDTVLVIPTGNGVNISHKPALKALEGFDTKMAYGGRPEGTFKKMTNTQTEMGKVSNLLTDMTIAGAREDELAKIVKHSMVIIDAEKHGLDYQASAKENDYAALKKKYQLHTNAEGNESTGAATLISRANAKINVPKTKGSGWVDPVTGEKKYSLSGEMYVPSKTDKKTNTTSHINKVTNKTTGVEEYVETVVDNSSGKVVYKGTPTRNFKEVPRTQKATQMSTVSDARELISPYDSPKERAYASYANTMKSMANNARLESLNTKPIIYSKEANAKYGKEVDSLLIKLSEAQKNAPLERKAQFLADSWEKEALEKDPSLKTNSGDLKKFRQQALSKAREDVGAHRSTIKIEGKEYEAIQKGAISSSRLNEIIKYMDDEDLKKTFTPHNGASISDAKISRIKSLAANGYTNAQIADALGISATSVSNYLNK